MNYVKRRLAVFLTMVMVLTSVFVAVPQQEVQAASNIHMMWIVGNSDSAIRVTKGVKDMYVGDYIWASKWTQSGDYTYYSFLSLNSGVTYKSSNKSIATVNSKTGKFTAKKTGTVTITVKFKGKTVKQKFRIVNNVKAEKAMIENLSAKEKAAKAFVKAYGNGKITTKNRYSVLSKYGAYREACGWNSGCVFDYKNGKTTYTIASPAMGRAYAKADKFAEYCSKYNPFVTTSSKVFKVKSISGSGKKVTISLKSKVDTTQLFGLAYAKTTSDGKYAGKKNSYSFQFKVWDEDFNYIDGTGVIKKGSNKITITLDKKLKKNKKYTISSYYGMWLYETKNTFKAK